MENKTYKDTAQARYKKKAQENLCIMLPKGRKEIWKQCANAHGMTLTKYLGNLISRDNPGVFDEESAEYFVNGSAGDPDITLHNMR